MTETRKRLNVVLAVGIADALLLLVLFYVAFVDRDEGAISVIGPIHGIGFVALLGLTIRGATEERWPWWFPAIVLVTGGPLGSIVGDVLVRRSLRAAPQP
jgi:integral membrane protein